MTLKMPGKSQSAQAAIKTNDEDIAKDSRSPQDEYVNDILVSLKELQAGEVIDAAESMREIRRELGIDANTVALLAIAQRKDAGYLSNYEIDQMIKDAGFA